MQRYKIKYYATPRGERLVSSWLKGLDKENEALVRSKINRLEESGLQLVGQQTLRRVDKDLYELKAGRYRIGVYHDTEHEVFVLLRGWKKQKDVQSDDVAEARSLLTDYKSQEGESHA